MRPRIRPDRCRLTEPRLTTAPTVLCGVAARRVGVGSGGTRAVGPDRRRGNGRPGRRASTSPTGRSDPDKNGAVLRETVTP
ncbi:MAG: hypothetical protein QOI74_794 [Micromonosporaceae bacterium]|nr:hypothetical protein [Micromonosporaceae bacterium]